MLLPISRTNQNIFAGVAQMWAIECENVKSLFFDSNGKIIAIEKTSDWKEIQFERNTAFLLQEKKAIGNDIIVSQKIYFEQTAFTQELITQLEALNCYGCLNIVIKDKSGMYHYCGISINKNVSQWEQQDMRTGDGYARTNTIESGQDSILVETLQCVAYNYAPFTDNPLSIPSLQDVIYYSGGFAFVTGDNRIFSLR